MNKHTAPNLVALIVLMLGLLLESTPGILLTSIGAFALSGALTNWIAVHMLFERVPGLYGSGVVTLHFEEFKTGILRMVHEQILNRESVQRVLEAPAQRSSEHAPDDAGKPTDAGIDLQPVIDKLDMDAAFDQLVSTIMESSFGGMLSMVGGQAALDPLREPIRKRMRHFLSDAARSPRLQQAVQAQIRSVGSSDAFIARLDAVLRARLDELTPEMVKDIMHRMIHQHLGWLVLWGGVFGALIGLVAGLWQVLS